jgi:hypothetical protein
MYIPPQPGAWPHAELLIFAIALVFFLVIREFWCWYFKINRVVRLLESIEASLRTLPSSPRGRNDG